MSKTAAKLRVETIFSVGRLCLSVVFPSLDTPAVPRSSSTLFTQLADGFPLDRLLLINSSIVILSSFSHTFFAT